MEIRWDGLYSIIVLAIPNIVTQALNLSLYTYMLFRGDLYLYRRGRKKQVSRIQKVEKDAERMCRDEERQERTVGLIKSIQPPLSFLPIIYVL